MKNCWESTYPLNSPKTKNWEKGLTSMMMNSLNLTCLSLRKETRKSYQSIAYSSTKTKKSVTKLWRCEKSSTNPFISSRGWSRSTALKSCNPMSIIWYRFRLTSWVIRPLEDLLIFIEEIMKTTQESNWNQVHIFTFYIILIETSITKNTWNVAEFHGSKLLETRELNTFC